MPHRYLLESRNYFSNNIIGKFTIDKFLVLNKIASYMFQITMHDTKCLASNI